MELSDIRGEYDLGNMITAATGISVVVLADSDCEPAPGIRSCFGTIAKNVAQGLTLHHDHGSRYVSDAFQSEPAFLASNRARRSYEHQRATATPSA